MASPEPPPLIETKRNRSDHSTSVCSGVLDGSEGKKDKKRKWRKLKMTVTLVTMRLSQRKSNQLGKSYLPQPLSIPLSNSEQLIEFLKISYRKTNVFQIAQRYTDNTQELANMIKIFSPLMIDNNLKSRPSRIHNALVSNADMGLLSQSEFGSSSEMEHG